MKYKNSRARCWNRATLNVDVEKKYFGMTKVELFKIIDELGQMLFETKPSPASSKKKSKCCNANIKVGGDTDGTKFYVCTKCLEACDVNPVPPTPSNKFTFDPPAVHNNGETELSLCPNCNCVTKTINSNCGKCRYTKSTSVASVIENIEIFGYDDGGFASQRAVLDLTIKINELIKQVNYLSSQKK